MSTSDPCDPAGDPFHPPATPTLVGCLHCRQVYESYLIEWRLEPDADGQLRGWWCCPTAGCGGRGFFFDIFPTDPDYEDERGGWVHCDDESEEYDEIDLDPPPPGPPDKPGDDEDKIPW